LSCSSYKLSYFHAKDFNHGKKEFKGWRKLKRQRFYKAINKIIVLPNFIYAVTAIHKDTHKIYKKKLRELKLKGFKEDSDCGMCLRAC